MRGIVHIVPSRVLHVCGCWVAQVGLAAAALSYSCDSAAQPLLASDGVQVHGFVSQGFIKSGQQNYLAESKRGSLEFSEAAVNFTKSFRENFRIGVQLFTHDLGPIGNYAPRFDWYYFDYRFRDWLGIRGGRTKIPFGLYNESSEVDAARVPILLPQSLYPVDHREYLLAQTGGEVYGRIPVEKLGGLEYRLYGGTLSTDLPGSPPPGITTSNVENPYVFGGRAMWLTPIDGLQLGASYQALRFDGVYHFAPELSVALESAGYLPPGSGGNLPLKFRVKMWVASVEYAANDLLVAAEYSRWIAGFESAAPRLLPTHVVNERYYVMASYRVAPWFTPGVYYSTLYDNVEQRTARDHYQRDFAVSLRYDLSEHWLFKLEGHYMSGTAALESSLNEGKAKNELAKTWGVFLAKFTAYF